MRCFRDAKYIRLQRFGILNLSLSALPHGGTWPRGEKGGVRWPRLPLCPRQQLPLWLASWPACRRQVFWMLRRPGTATTCGGKSPVPFLLMAKLTPLRSSCAEFADHARLCVPLRQPFRDYVVPLHVELSVCRPCAQTPHTELLQSCDVCRRAATWQRFET